MRFTTKTEYGLICLIYMANHGGPEPITSKEVVRGEKYSLAFTEKILQKLRAAKIVKSVQGNHGGYVLARPASEINFREIVEAIEGQTFEVFCEPDVRKEIVCTHFTMCGVKPVWAKTKELLDNYFSSITLEMLTRNEIKPPPSIKSLAS